MIDSKVFSNSHNHDFLEGMGCFLPDHIPLSPVSIARGRPYSLPKFNLLMSDECGFSLSFL